MVDAYGPLYDSCPIWRPLRDELKEIVESLNSKALEDRPESPRHPPPLYARSDTRSSVVTCHVTFDKKGNIRFENRRGAAKKERVPFTCDTSLRASAPVDARAVMEQHSSDNLQADFDRVIKLDPDHLYAEVKFALNLFYDCYHRSVRCHQRNQIYADFQNLYEQLGNMIEVVEGRDVDYIGRLLMALNILSVPISNQKGMLQYQNRHSFIIYPTMLRILDLREYAWAFLRYQDKINKDRATDLTDIQFGSFVVPRIEGHKQISGMYQLYTNGTFAALDNFIHKKCIFNQNLGYPTNFDSLEDLGDKALGVTLRCLLRKAMRDAVWLDAMHTKITRDGPMEWSELADFFA